MKSIAFATLGCKVNQCDTQSFIELFQHSGYKIVDFSEIADIYIINTCTVTGTGDKKSRQMISKAHKQNESAIIAVTGCYAQRAKEEIMSLPGVSLVIGTADRANIVQLIEQATTSVFDAVTDIKECKTFENLPLSEYNDKTRAFIKIQDGCDNYCSYCIIPYTRGRARSRSLADILAECESLATNGYKEIVLTGINLTSYGKDTNYKETLCDVIDGVCAIDSIKRVALGSLEPILITDEFMQRLIKNTKLCPQFHLSLQSGSDTVLKRMNRHYNTSQYAAAVGLIREYYKDAAITTDIIVGFPDESEQEFIETLEFVDKIRFAWVHVFAYSMRTGTVAAKMSNQISAQVKKDRSSILIKKCMEIGKEYREQFVGKTMHVLCVSTHDDEITAITKEHLEVSLPMREGLLNSIVEVTITGVPKDGLIGREVN